MPNLHRDCSVLRLWLSRRQWRWFDVVDVEMLLPRWEGLTCRAVCPRKVDKLDARQGLSQVHQAE